MGKKITQLNELISDGFAPDDLLLVRDVSATKDKKMAAGVLTGKLLDHNIPRLVPKDITSYITDGSIARRLTGGYKSGSSGDKYSLFEDIFVGDYWQMSRAITAPDQDSQYATTGTDWVTIAGIDTLFWTGDQSTGINYHHLVMVPGKGYTDVKNHFGRKRMNPTNTTVGGYVASEMHTTTIGEVVSAGSTATGATINQQLFAEFSGSHPLKLKTTRELLTNQMTATLVNRFGSADGASSGWAWTSVQACLMTEVEVYGSTVFSSSGYDVGSGCLQLPLFREKRALNNRGSYWWLRAVASSAHFCGVNNYGYANYNVASSTNNCVRPRFVLGA